MYICEVCQQLKTEDEMATETLCRYCDMRREAVPPIVRKYWDEGSPWAAGLTKLLGEDYPLGSFENQDD